MARTKLRRLQKINELTNVFNSKDPDIKAKMKNYFNSAMISTLEIGCGHGDYIVEFAQKSPEKKFLGIDVKGARIFQGAIKAMELNLRNIAFWLTKAENLPQIITPKSIEEIYVLFPEPHQKRSKQNRRLMTVPLIKLYKELLMDSGQLHFKTDNLDLYEYALKNIVELEGKIIHTTKDLHSAEQLKIDSGVLTNFEKYYINEGRKIKYICSSFN